jgi:hypothetical protein
VVASEEKKSRGDPAEEAITTIKKLSGTKLTGQTIDCLSLINRKEKKKNYSISLVLPVLQEQLIRINAKDCPKPSTETS